MDGQIYDKSTIHQLILYWVSYNLEKQNWFTKLWIFIYQFFFLPFCLCLLGSCQGMDRRLEFCRHCRHCRFWLKLREGVGQQLWRLQHRRGWYPVEQRGTFICSSIRPPVCDLSADLSAWEGLLVAWEGCFEVWEVWFNAWEGWFEAWEGWYED